MHMLGDLAGIPADASSTVPSVDNTSGSVVGRKLEKIGALLLMRVKDVYARKGFNARDIEEPLADRRNWVVEEVWNQVYKVTQDTGIKVVESLHGVRMRLGDIEGTSNATAKNG
jgi:hypothetical protein